MKIMLGDFRRATAVGTALSKAYLVHMRGLTRTGQFMVAEGALSEVASKIWGAGLRSDQLPIAQTFGVIRRTE